MKTPKLLKEIRDYLDSAKKKQRREMGSIKEVLKKLKKKQRALKEKLDKATNKSDRHQLQNEIKIIHAQREKGLKVLKKLQRES